MLPTVSDLIQHAVAKNFPGLTVKEVERRLGKKRNYIQQWCDPHLELRLPPVHETIYALANCLGLESGDLWVAFWRDCSQRTDSPLYEVANSPQAREGLTSVEREIIDRFHAADPALWHKMFAVMDVFLATANAPAPSAPSPSEASPQVRTGDLETERQSVTEQTRRTDQHHPDAIAS